MEEQEEGVSGHKVRAANRDKLQLIKEATTRGEFDILLVFMFDRIDRIADETPFVVEWFVRNGIQVWSTQEGEQRFDSHADKLMNYIRFWQADGESSFTPEILSELVEQEEARNSQLRQRWQSLQQALEQSQETRRQLEQQYSKIVSMAEMYDAASLEAKKMIVSQMIERVDVGRGYHIELTFRQDFREFFEVLSESKEEIA
ncbi:MAG: recombinase family protein [Clostridiales bacterium]|nr:recombinase family protein [Clostridiales bacterium]